MKQITLWFNLLNIPSSYRRTTTGFKNTARRNCYFPAWGIPTSSCFSLVTDRSVSPSWITKVICHNSSNIEQNIKLDIFILCFFRSTAVMHDLKQSTSPHWVRFMHHLNSGMFWVMFTFSKPPAAPLRKTTKRNGHSSLSKPDIFVFQKLTETISRNVKTNYFYGYLLNYRRNGA